MNEQEEEEERGGGVRRRHDRMRCENLFTCECVFLQHFCLCVYEDKNLNEGYLRATVGNKSILECTKRSLFGLVSNYENIFVLYYCCLRKIKYTNFLIKVIDVKTSI